MRNALMLLAFFVALPMSLAQETSTEPPSVPREPPRETVATASSTASQQVMLKVRILQFSRTKLTELGLRFTEGATQSPRSTVDVLRDYAQPKGAGAPGGCATVPAGFCVLEAKDPFFAALELLAKEDFVKTLGDPTVVTVSNRAVSFHCGGEFPVPTPQGAGSAGVEWRRYGSMLDFLPVVLPDQTIRLECRVELSEIDPAHSVTVGGQTVPGLLSRQVETTADVRPGKTLVLSGLVQTHVEAELVELPESGSSGESGNNRVVRKTANEIETVVLLTPELATVVR